MSHHAFLTMGPWTVALMIIVCLACAASALGLWLQASWGRRVAVAVLGVNLVGDARNAVLRGDLRTLIGLPIGLALIAYLISPGVARATRDHSP